MRQFLYIFLCFFSLNLSAVEGRFLHYGSAEGLSSNTVYAITEDAEGFLWIGTRSGLNRFDGAHFVAYKELGRVNALTCDRGDHLWVGTTDGLYVKDGTHFAEGPRGNVRALLTDSEGYVWATVGDTLLLKLAYTDGVTTVARSHYEKRYHEGDYPYFQIYEDASGKLYPAGRLTQTQVVEDRNHPSSRGITSLLAVGAYAEAGGRLYCFEDHTSQLCVVDGEEGTRIGRLPVAHARLLTDHSGKLWAAGSYGLGLVNTDAPEETVVYKTSSQELFCIYEDRQGNIWVGGDNGLDVLCPALQQVHRLADGNITALLEDHTGKLWVGRSEDRVSRIYEDSRGTVYVGLWNNTGFQIWNGDRMKMGVVEGPIPEAQWKAASGDRRSSNWISDFLEDSRGRFWVVTWEGVGLNEWDRLTGKTLPPGWLSPEWYPSARTDSSIYLSSRLGSRLIEDAQGNLVFATTEAGFNVIDRETSLVTKYYKENSTIPDDYVTDLCLRPDGSIWAATRAGLWSPSGEHFLDGMLVQSLLSDESGRLWAGTEEGLYFVDTDGSVGRVGKELGLPSDIYGEKVACTLADGALAFGGAYGAAAFHPDSLLQLSAAPVFLTDFSTEEGGVRFSFGCRNLPLTSLLRYRYRIAGVDEDWTLADYPRLQGRYSVLFPGRYRLEIQYTDLFGRWQDSAFSYRFRIRPPLLLRWPFLLLYLMLFAGAMWLLVRFRENRQRTLVLQQELDTRNRFFGIISHDLRSPVSGMKTLASALENAPEEELRPGIHVISDAAARTSAMLENLLMWSLGQKGVLRPVLRDVLLADVLREAAGTRKVEMHFAEGLSVHADPNMLTTCLRNLLDNAFRYSPDYVCVEADQRHIVVRDHGAGMDEETLRTLSRPGHLGLTITQELLEKMGGSLKARNLPEGGCEMTILL